MYTSATGGMEEMKIVADSPELVGAAEGAGGGGAETSGAGSGAGGAAGAGAGAGSAGGC